MLLNIISSIMANILPPFGAPVSPCPDYFSYIKTSPNSYSGIITLDHIPVGVTEVVAVFLQTLPNNMPSYSLYQQNLDEAIVRHVDVKDGPVQITFSFKDLENLPTLERLIVNGTIRCKAQRTRFSLQPLYKTFLRISIVNEHDAVTDKATETKIRKHVKAICGTEGASSYMYGGTELRRGDFPWKVALFTNNIYEPQYFCGGSLISDRAVITAAHCVVRQKSSDIMVQLGRHDLRIHREPNSVQRDVRKIIMHPDYEETSDGDIAILIMERLKNFTSVITPVCLWDPKVDTVNFVGKEGVVAGWGSDEMLHPDTPIAKRTDVKIVSNRECIRSTPEYIYQMSDRSMCAGNLDGTGPCQGDSGSGLFLFIDGRWVLRGIVSRGQMHNIRCNLYKYVLYADASKYMDWIQKNAK